jgi:hypothetical protein
MQQEHTYYDFYSELHFFILIYHKYLGMIVFVYDNKFIIAFQSWI